MKDTHIIGVLTSVQLREGPDLWNKTKYNSYSGKFDYWTEIFILVNAILLKITFN